MEQPDDAAEDRLDEGAEVARGAVGDLEDDADVSLLYEIARPCGVRSG